MLAVEFHFVSPSLFLCSTNLNSFHNKISFQRTPPPVIVLWSYNNACIVIIIIIIIIRFFLEPLAWSFLFLLPESV